MAKPFSGVSDQRCCSGSMPQFSISPKASLPKHTTLPRHTRRKLVKQAPVYISVYDRPAHLKACIESLRKNQGAERTTLFIASDGPRCDRSARLVAQVRDYIKSIHGFRKVVSLMPGENTNKKLRLDLFGSMLESNDKFIAAEDDNIFSPFFLKFMNDALEAYFDSRQVAAVCGYNYPGFPFEKPEILSLKCFAAWGWGGWRHKENAIFSDHQCVARRVLKDPMLFKRINAQLPHIAPTLQDIAEGKLRAGDIVRCCLLFENNQVCMLPSATLVRNTGHDGSGANCKQNHVYSNQIVYQKEIPVEQINDLTPNKQNTAWLFEYFGGSKLKMRNRVMYFSIREKSKFSKRIACGLQSFLTRLF